MQQTSQNANGKDRVASVDYARARQHGQDGDRRVPLALRLFLLRLHFSDHIFALAAWVSARNKPATPRLAIRAVVDVLTTFVPAPFIQTLGKQKGRRFLSAQVTSFSHVNLSTY
jgi:hypothetical protein